MVKRFQIWLVSLETSATNSRPCVIVSPDEISNNLEYVTIAPITSEVRNYPTRVSLQLFGSEKFIAVDQLQTIEKEQLTKLIGEIDENEESRLLETLQEIFAK